MWPEGVVGEPPGVPPRGPPRRHAAAACRRLRVGNRRNRGLVSRGRLRVARETRRLAGRGGRGAVRKGIEMARWARIRRLGFVGFLGGDWAVVCIAGFAARCCPVARASKRGRGHHPVRPHRPHPLQLHRPPARTQAQARVLLRDERRHGRRALHGPRPPRALHPARRVHRVPDERPLPQPRRRRRPAVQPHAHLHTPTVLPPALHRRLARGADRVEGEAREARGVVGGLVAVEVGRGEVGVADDVDGLDSVLLC
mmetsp:Transcript_51926/g.135541  ORF Transcript_51926/g.135541 Transcript_51926/m.135541 type:complete len:255 (+) Transcript_51926:501-1265(+)